MRRLAGNFPNASAVQVQLGSLYAEQGNAAAARTAYERALERDPDNLEAIAALTRLDLAQKNGARATSRVAAALAKSPDDAPLLMLDAVTARAVGDTERSERQARRALDEGGEIRRFVNVFVAAVLAHAAALDEPEVVAILNDERPDSFTFEDDFLAWRGRRAATQQVSAIRRDRVISFGSCSFDEPRDDLRALGWL